MLKEFSLILAGSLVTSTLLVASGCGNDLTGDNDLYYDFLDLDSDGEIDSEFLDGVDNDSDGVPDDIGDTAGGDSGNDNPNDTSGNSGPPRSLTIEAECAIGEFSGDCNAAYSGDVGAADGVSDLPRLDDGNPGIVGYTTGGSWLKFNGIDMTGLNTITMRLASEEADAVLSVHVDSPSGPELATFVLGSTGDWDTYEERTEVFKVGFTGTKDLYVVAETEHIGNGNIDWITLEEDRNVNIETDPDYLHIEAECAVSSTQGECNDAYSGGTSQSDPPEGWTDVPATLPNVSSSTPDAMGYLVGDGGATWMRIDDVDLTDMKKVRVKAGVGDDSCGLKFYIDGPTDSDGTLIAALSLSNTGAWDVHQEFEVALASPVSGSHNLYVLGGNPDSGNAQLDWIEFE